MFITGRENRNVRLSYEGMVRLRCALLLLLALPLSALELHIEAVDTQPGDCRFRFVYDDEAENPPDRRQRNILRATTASYNVWIDPDAIQKEKFDIRFNYEFYAQLRSGGPIRRIDVEATPKGAFEDRYVLARFQLIEGQQKEDGQITLPVFGETVADSLAGETDRQDAFLANPKTFDLPLKNLSNSWLEIREVRASGDGDLWQSVTVDRKGAPIRVEMKQTSGDQLKVTLKPNVVQAFVRALTPRSQDAIDDTITAYVTYDTRARRGRQYSIKIPVRFVPWMPQLFLIVIVGAFVGSFVPKSARGKKWTERMAAFGSVVPVAVLAELLAMVLKATKTGITLFGFDLDPFQLPTAGIIGVFVGMAGYRSLALFLKVIESGFWKRKET